MEARQPVSKGGEASGEPRLEARTQPTQARGRRSIRAIIDAAHRILRDNGPAGLTTPAVARQAGVSIGAIYHYFPNKEAIVLALFEAKLADIRSIVEEPIIIDTGNDWRLALRDWLKRVKARESDIDFDLSMNEAMDHYPALREVSRRHATAQAQVIAGHLRQLGSSWPDAALFDVALHGYFLNSSVWQYWSHAGAPLPQGVDRLADTIIALFEPAVTNAPPPAPPYATSAA
jgi:AcrR family transcriptional regulator